MVKHKKSTKDVLMIAGLISAAIVLSLMLVLFLFGRLMGFELLVLAAVWYFAVMLVRKTSIEYEYILTNSNLDIDKIMSKKARKRVISIDFASIDVCAPADAAGNADGRKVLDLSGDIAGSGVYYADFSKNSVRYRVFFQPNSKILSGIKTANPRLVTVRQDDLV